MIGRPFKLNLHSPKFKTYLHSTNYRKMELLTILNAFIFGVLFIGSFIIKHSHKKAIRVSQ